jgi:hypothetical protein
MITLPVLITPTISGGGGKHDPWLKRMRTKRGTFRSTRGVWT